MEFNMAGNDKKHGAFKSIIVKSIGAAIALSDDKKNSSAIIIAYATEDSGNNIGFTALKLNKKRSYTREDFLSAISHAENIPHVTYVDFDGTDKDIYICRGKEGAVYDFVERDNFANRYVDGFAEIEASNLQFETDTETLKFENKSEVSVSYNVLGSNYPENSTKYAIINAFNACLLGRVFSKEEFRLQTGDGKRAKYEIRGIPSKYIDPSTLYVKPERTEGNGFVSSYITEPMNVINGDEVSNRVYKLTYTARISDYYITRYN